MRSWWQCISQAWWKSLPALSAKTLLKRKQVGLSKLVFSSCITWLSQLVVVTDFKQRPDSIWQQSDLSFLLLARLQAITVVSHAEPTICQPYFCLHHHLRKHQKAIRDRQGWQFAYFFRQVHSKTCVWAYFKNKCVFLHLGKSLHRGDQKSAAASGFIL